MLVLKDISVAAYGSHCSTRVIQIDKGHVVISVTGDGQNVNQLYTKIDADAIFCRWYECGMINVKEFKNLQSLINS